MSVIEVRSLTRRYGNRRGIEDVTLSVGEGALYGFLGPNGAGKTTTIRILMGFMQATTGSARILGMDCWTQSHHIKANVGFIPGDLRLWGWLTGRSALKHFGSMRSTDITKHGEALAEELELDLHVRVGAMSRGMRQKLGLILALAHQPRVLILDEPTTALDPLVQERLRSILRRMAQAGHTVFFSSHTLGEVETLCDRVAIVREGRIVADSTLADLQQRAGHEVTIDWREDEAGRANAQLAAPKGLLLDRVEARRWQGRYEGEVSDLINALSGKPIADLSITRPDLETLFRRYYTDGGAP